LNEILANNALLISVTAWTIAQLFKLVVGLVREKRFDLGFFIRSGGIASAHTALVTALATSVAIMQGLDSIAFAIAAVFAVIVMYDAAGVRLSVSRQSVVLNRIVRELRERRPGELEHDLRELIGHTPVQVFIGAAVGISTAWIWLTISGT
jgi:acid phosphatase family membrane protein YuiD